jgi:Vault protein inter-alpha-trypsin domain
VPDGPPSGGGNRDVCAPSLLAQPGRDDPSADVTQGALRVTSREGRVVECPLRHTDVQATISGFVARVKVAQDFVNPWDEPIEAVYVFPLSHSGAVDDMTMVVGTRRIVGVIKRRAEARAVYEQALAEGRTASLLEQERPNVFTQSVGNIPPHGKVRIEISYVDLLAYDRGAYEFHFPMVVGPRYVPGTPLAGPSSGDGWAPDTTRVPDASRVTPPVLRPGERTGHDIALSSRSTSCPAASRTRRSPSAGRAWASPISTSGARASPRPSPGSPPPWASNGARTAIRSWSRRPGDCPRRRCGSTRRAAWLQGTRTRRERQRSRLRGTVGADVVILDPEHVLVEGDAAAHARAPAALGGASESERRERVRQTSPARPT